MITKATLDATERLRDVDADRPRALAGFQALLKLRDQLHVGTVETPARALAAYLEMTSGYDQDPVEILSKQFDATGIDQMVVLAGIRFVSLCEHHLLPFTGTADVGYIATDRVVGLSKLARVTHCFARRLQMQERLTSQIAHAIESELVTKGVAVRIRAHHSCMSCRGVREQDAQMVTSVMLGAFRDNPETRAEFMELTSHGNG